MLAARGCVSPKWDPLWTTFKLGLLPSAIPLALLKLLFTWRLLCQTDHLTSEGLRNVSLLRLFYILHTLYKRELDYAEGFSERGRHARSDLEMEGWHQYRDDGPSGR